MGLPSVVTDINGCNEIIAHEKNGLIILPKDTQSLYEAMKQLSTQSLFYANLKANSREMITSRYERQAVWDSLLEEYHSLLKSKT